VEVVILDRGELALLWFIALVAPPVAQGVAHLLSLRLGLPPGRPLPRIALLTVGTVGTLVWLTGSRFASLHIDDEAVRMTYAPPLVRTLSIPRENVKDVSLSEQVFPNRSFSITIRDAGGEEYRSVGVTTEGLEPLYRIFRAFRPGEHPYVALR